MFQQLIATIIFILALPLLSTLALSVKLTSKGPIIFQQKRAGKNNKPFVLYKFRTMKLGSEKRQQQYKRLNEADGPVFKIYNDPRYTRIGKFFAHTGLDELPQLINIIKGEMVFVGPRPLPISEAKKVPNQYQKRFQVLPGITSPWVILGSHDVSFNTWMQSDLEYVDNKSLKYDLKIALSTIVLICKFIFYAAFVSNVNLFFV